MLYSNTNGNFNSVWCSKVSQVIGHWLEFPGYTVPEYFINFGKLETPTLLKGLKLGFALLKT